MSDRMERIEEQRRQRAEAKGKAPVISTAGAEHPDGMTAMEALERFATRSGNGWIFNDSGASFWHSEEQAIAIASACLMLDVPVTDRMDSQTWLKLVTKVVRLEERLTRMEGLG